MEELTGTYLSTRWSADDGGFLVGELESGEVVVGAGTRQTFVPGLEYRFAGEWQNHDQYGRQFRYRGYAQSTPYTREAVTAYLLQHLPNSGCGIGAVRIQQLVDAFGAAEVIPVMRNHPELIHQTVPAITLEGAQKAQSVLVALQEFESTRIELTSIFAKRGFRHTLPDLCLKKWGVQAAERVKRDPFCLLVAKMPSCGFLRVDALYLALGHPPNKLKRQMLCAWDLMSRTRSTWHDVEWIREELRRLISSAIRPNRAIKLGIRSKWLAKRMNGDDRVWIGIAKDAADEDRIVARLAESL